MSETIGSRTVERRLTAVLAADLAGYSRLMGRDEVGTLARLTRLRREIVDPAITACRGRLIKTTGDGLLVAFDSIVDAVLCGAVIQRGLAQHNAGIAESEQMLFRIGVNIGDVILARDDIFGDSVNIAARLETLAEPGGICLSKAAHDQVRGKISADFVDLGAHAVKNIALPVEVFALPPGAIAAIPDSELARRPAPAARRPLLILALAGCVGLLAAGGGAYLYAARQGPPESFEARLNAALERVLPNLSAKARERVIASYLGISRPRAFAIAPNAQARMPASDGPSREAVITRALESCQISFNEPCALIAVDNELMASGADGRFAATDMPRPHYSGSFDPARIPAMRPALASRPEVRDYAAAAAPKAAALSIHGVFTIVTTAPTQRAAELQALQACNDNPAARRTEGTCFLYAVGDTVVLPQRLTAPLTPP